MPIMVKPSKSRTSSQHPGTARGGTGFSASMDEAPDSRLHLADHFLIAMPSMLDPVFGGTVVYICEHNADGALGIIVNKATDMTMDVLLERIDLGADPVAGRIAVDKKPVMFGGPVQVERGFVLHSPHGDYSSMMKVNERVALTTSKDVLEEVAAGRGPERILVTLGCAGWSAGQLEEEIVRNGWLTVRAEPSVIFDLPAEQRFTAAMKLLGIDPMMLTGDAGHA
ncbi:YqgE/AlgH family protein [Noviherbaspirillum aerium]|uniref:YqgE/AlgH family protein n=1 Tax=Noviherbaspirillum aerium TaxID=2588497 RepID=UPI00384A4C84